MINILLEFCAVKQRALFASRKAARKLGQVVVRRSLCCNKRRRAGVISVIATSKGREQSDLAGGKIHSQYENVKRDPCVKGANARVNVLKRTPRKRSTSQWASARAFLRNQWKCHKGSIPKVSYSLAEGRKTQSTIDLGVKCALKNVSTRKLSVSNINYWWINSSRIPILQE